MAHLSASRVHPVQANPLAIPLVRRGTLLEVPLNQLDLATSNRSIVTSGLTQKKTEGDNVRSGMTLEEVRWSGMRSKIPGMSSTPKGKTKMYVDLDPHTQFMQDLRQFVRQHFHQKECSMFVPVTGQKVRRSRDLKCHCGEVLMSHAGMQAQATSDLLQQFLVPKELQRTMRSDKRNDPPPDRLPEVKWNPDCIRRTFTAAYGKVNFINVEHLGGKKPAKYIRMSDEDSVDDLIKLMIDYWKIMEPKAPNLVISVVGGAKNFKLDGRMRDTFSSGLIKAAKTTSAWVISSGFNTGVMKEVGHAVRQGQSFSWDNDRMAHVLRCIGIAPWGYIRGRRQLESQDGQGKFYADLRTSNVIIHGEPVPLNPDHTHFIFVDDGYRNRYGGVADVRAQLEQRVSQPVNEGGLGIPVVLVVVEGGTDAIADARKSLEHKIPVVVCSGTGRAADILAYAYSHTITTSRGERQMKDKYENKLKEKIFEAYGKSWKEADVEWKKNQILDSVKACCQNTNLLIIFNMNKHEDLDLAILSVLLKAYAGADEGQRLSQLKLALTWNRVDIAQEEIFREDVLWPQGSLDGLLTDAIMKDKVKFIGVVLQQGVMMKEYLTYDRLDKLYMAVPRNNSIYQLMFKLTGKEVLNHDNVLTLLMKLLDSYDGEKEYNIAELERESEQEDVKEWDPKQIRFVRPYKQLMIFAVLLNRQKLARFCWEMGDEPVTSAIAATRLFSAMERHVPRHESAHRDKLVTSRLYFEQLATSVLNECHHKDPEKAMMIVERKSPTWSELTCLQLAASATDQLFLSSAACQNSIGTTWKHGILSDLRKVILAVLFPPTIIFFMEIVSMGQIKLTWFQKLATFYSSPVSKFTHGTLMYLVFLVLHSYLILVDFQPLRVTPLEVVCAFWVFTFLLDEVHTFICVPSVTMLAKMRDWYDLLKWLRLLNYVLAIIGFFIHVCGGNYRNTKIIYCINAVIYFVRVMKAYTASANLGPKLVMIYRMLGELRMFIMVLIVFLLAYGVASQGLLYHLRSPSWVIVKDILYFPYWQLYGEIFLEELETDSCTADSLNCRTFHWLVPILLAAYLLVGNILLLNLLIAIFSHVFDQVEQNSIQIWKYQMYYLVMEYETKTFLVPPFSFLMHVVLSIRWIVRKTCFRKTKNNQHFSRRHLEYLQLFEKEMMANYLRRNKAEEKSTVMTTISRLQKRVDELTKLIEDEVIADQQPTNAPLILSNDGRTLHPLWSLSADSGSIVPHPWPSVPDIMSVADQVQQTEIPPEYFRRTISRESMGHPFAIVRQESDNRATLVKSQKDAIKEQENLDEKPKKKDKKDKKKKKKKHRSKERENLEPEEKKSNVVDIKLNDVNLPPNIFEKPEPVGKFIEAARSKYPGFESLQPLYENVRAESRASSAPPDSDRKSPDTQKTPNEKTVEGYTSSRKSVSPHAKRNRESRRKLRSSGDNQGQLEQRSSKEWQYEDLSDDQNVSYSLQSRRVQRRGASFGRDMDSSDSDEHVHSTLRRRLSQKKKKRVVSDSD